ncbi:MAG: aminopeptidase [Oscillospiraceae bacterium]
MEDKKTAAELLQEKLIIKKESGYKCFEKKFKAEIAAYCENYIEFMNSAKTEREFTVLAIDMLKKEGFSEFCAGYEYKAGDKVYFNNRKKSLIAAVIGTKPLDTGANITAAHIDSPRLDLKPNPLYEDNGLGYFKTHYYGGIKKYQWVTLPLSIHGTIVMADGTAVNITIGEDDSDPVFCVTDILPHLSNKIQDDRKARDVIKGEELNVLLGSEPFDDEKISEPVKLNLMRILNEKYGIVEADFVSAEIEIVPALKARYIGFDKSLIGAYAHDDRVCAYTALTAFLSIGSPAKTNICILADKEEVGSDGNTGLNSDFLKNFLSLLSKSCKCEVETVIHNSRALSADVNAAFDPSFAEVNERRNCAYLNYGPVLTKYTGARGKSSTNDASAEFVGEMRRLFDSNGIPWQTGELGKVDEGGGGTVAKFISSLGMEVVDIGVALLSMHSPYEVASRIDIFAMYRAFCAFYN